MLNTEEALKAYARMMNTYSVSDIEPLLVNDFHYASQWVFHEITSKQEYLDYITPKLLTVKNSNNPVFAEMAWLGFVGDNPCVLIAQGKKDNLVATVLVEVKNNLIQRIDMCCVPTPESAIRTSVYPA